MPEFPPTSEQTNILDAVRTTKQNIMIRARAGCGKTTMLELIDHAEKAQPYLLMCFNKAIATEAEKRMRSATTSALLTLLLLLTPLFSKILKF